MRISVRGGWLISSSGSQAVNALAGMLTNVLYARALGLHDVGLVALVNAIGMLSTVFLDRGIGAWMTRALAARDISIRQSLLVTIRAATPGLAILASIGLTVPLAATRIPADVAFVCLFGVPFIAAFWIFQVGLSMTQGLSLPNLRSAGVALNGFLTLGFTALVLFFGGGAPSAMIATIVAYLVVGLIMIYLSGRRGEEPRLANTRITFRRIIRSSRPLFGSNIVTYAVSAGDILLAGAILSTAQVGQYQIAKKIAQAAVLPLIATLPMVFGKISSRHDAERKDFIVRFVQVSSTYFVVALALGWFFFPTLIPLFFGANYSQIAIITLVLMAAFQFQFFRDLLSVYVNSKEDYARSFRVNLLTALTFILLAFSFSSIMTLSMFTAITLITFCLGFVFHLSLSWRKDQWDRKGILQLTACTGALVLVICFIQLFPSWPGSPSPS